MLLCIFGKGCHRPESLEYYVQMNKDWLWLVRGSYTYKTIV